MAQARVNIPEQDHRTVETFNPTTGELHQTYTMHTPDELNEIVERAHTAFLDWRKTSLAERAEVMNKTADILERDADELAQMLARQMGRPVAQGKAEAQLCAQILRYTASEGPTVLADEERDIQGEKRGVISYAPMGVILGMQPWNFPLYQCMRYASAVMMAGNSTVFKHAQVCFETAVKIQEMYEEAGLPRGVFSVIFASGKDADELIDHDRVRGVTFTGSEGVGRTIGELAGKALKPTVLELGGSDPYFVLEDADIDAAVETCVWGRINNAGQTCVAAKRFFIHDAIYDEFRDRFVERMKEVGTGDPLDPDTLMGPLYTHDAREDLHDKVQKTVQGGATLLCGGEIPEGDGAFYPATVLENVPEGTPGYDDELFGPAAVLFRYTDLDDAIEIANSHKYGLGGGVISGDEERAIEICRDRLDVGFLNVNGYGLAHPAMPFGGTKDSGWGREHGGFGLRAFVNVKGIIVRD